MSGILKGGWHPKGKGEGGKESWRSDFKGVNQIAKLAGRGKDDSLSNNGGMQSGLNHSSAPLSTLKDPASFGPPPRHVAAGGTPAPVRATASSSASTATRPSPAPQKTAEPQWQAPAPREEEQPPASTPYRSNTTGMSTAGMPIPPARRTQTQPAAARPAPPPRPSLPPRQNSRPDLHTPEPPPSYDAAVQQPGEREGYVNQAAVGRLGQAGINMSAFSTGQTSSQTSSSTPSGSQGHPGQMNELQARFSRMKTTASPSSETAPASGTSWAQKQQAAQTASKFRNDPSSVSLTDARDAASTANNFRQRHGEQVSAGWKAANSLNQRFGGAGGNSPSTEQPAAAELPSSSNAAVPAGKRPPPPPPKRKELQASQSADPGAPPPIPAASKPRF